MVDFSLRDEHLRDGFLIAEGHGHDGPDLFAGLAAALTAERGQAQAQAHAAMARFTETWFSDHELGGFGHDCDLHQDVGKALWSPGCGTFRPVTAAAGIPPVAQAERAGVQR